MSDVTYGRLDEVLRALGFSVRLADLDPRARVYKHAGTGALVVVPALPENEKVLPHHLLTARVTLDGFGIADPLTFDAQLHKAS